MITLSRTRSIVAAFVALLALVVVGFGPAPSASAWQYDPYRVVGQVGNIQFAGPMITAVAGDQPTFRAGAFTVHPSPAGGSGDQTVLAQISLQLFDGNTWTDVASSEILRGHVSATTTWTFATWQVSAPVLGHGATYRTEYAVQWFDDNSGLSLSGGVIQPSTAGRDTACAIPACTASAAGVTR